MTQTYMQGCSKASTCRRSVLTKLPAEVFAQFLSLRKSSRHTLGFWTVCSPLAQVLRQTHAGRGPQQQLRSLGLEGSIVVRA